jgi:hypothetical protein
MTALATLPELPRFWAKVREVDGGCWEWTGSLNRDGYGNAWASGACRGAHRVAFEAMVCDIPADLELDHLCRNRACVNPYHMDMVTHRVNIRRGILGDVLRARAAAITHCPRDHEYTPANTMQQGNKRKCRTCHNDRRRALRAMASC